MFCYISRASPTVVVRRWSSSLPGLAPLALRRPYVRGSSTVTFRDEPSAQESGEHKAGRRDRRRWSLVVALVVAIGIGGLFFRSVSPWDHNVGALIFLESLPVIALIWLQLPEGPRAFGPIVAYLAAVWLAFVSYGIASDPGGSPSALNPLHPPPLNTSQSLVGVTIACAAVMICASLYTRGRVRIAMNLCTALVLSACIAVKTLIYV